MAVENVYAQNFFNLANAITGFAIVQMITFLVAFGTSTDFANNVSSAPGCTITFAGTVIATAFYVTAVVACGIAEGRLLPSAEPAVIRLIRWTIAGRAFAIAAISGFGLFVLWRIAKHAGC